MFLFLGWKLRPIISLRLIICTVPVVLLAAFRAIVNLYAFIPYNEAQSHKEWKGTVPLAKPITMRIPFLKLRKTVVESTTKPYEIVAKFVSNI